jgi:hypothetical protein
LPEHLHLLHAIPLLPVIPSSICEGAAGQATRQANTAPGLSSPISHRNPGSGTAYKRILSMDDQSNATSAEEFRTNHYSISEHEVCCFCQTASKDT